MGITENTRLHRIFISPSLPRKEYLLTLIPTLSGLSLVVLRYLTKAERMCHDATRFHFCVILLFLLVDTLVNSPNKLKFIFKGIKIRNWLIKLDID